MVQIDFYGILSESLESDLESMVSNIKDGRLITRGNDYQPVTEGLENKDLHGIGIIRNGTRLLQRMVDDGLLLEENISPSIRMRNGEDFKNFLDDMADEDGVYIFEPDPGDLYRVIDVDPPKKSIINGIPGDFVYAMNQWDRVPDSESNLKVGTKTRLGFHVTRHYPGTSAFFKKRSGYSPLGIGKVGMTEGFLNKEKCYFYVKDRKIQGAHVSDSVYIPYEKGLVGIERKYHGSAETGIDRSHRDERICYTNAFRTVAELMGHGDYKESWAQEISIKPQGVPLVASSSK